MACFFIDVEIGDLIAEDDEGKEFSDQEAAKAEALAALLDQARNRRSFDNPLEFTVAVRDGTSVVFKASAHAMCRPSETTCW